MGPGRGFVDEPSRVVLHKDAHQYRLEILDLADAVMAMPDTSTRLKAALGKWPGLFARLALMFHLIDAADARAHGQVPILDALQPETAKRVAAYMRDVLMPSLLPADAIMFSTTQTGHARWIAGYILAHGLTRISVRDVVREDPRALRAPERRAELQSVMASLEAVGWLRGPPDVSTPTRWLVNPKVHEIFATQAEDERARKAGAREGMGSTKEARE